MNCPAWFPDISFELRDYKKHGFVDVTKSKEPCKAWDLCLGPGCSPAAVIWTRDTSTVFQHDDKRSPFEMNQNWGYSFLRYMGKKNSISEVASLPLPLP